MWAIMAYDEYAGKTILFGVDGRKGTWSYDSAKNTWAKLHTTGSPGPRNGATMFYDANRHGLVMTGGQEANPESPMFPDCWAFTY